MCSLAVISDTKSSCVTVSLTGPMKSAMARDALIWLRYEDVVRIRDKIAGKRCPEEAAE